MNLKFFNNSKSTINIMVDSEIFSVLPNNSYSVVINSKNADIGFCLDSKSFLSKLGSFDFQLLSLYNIAPSSDEAIIYMNAYKIGGDNWEYYSYVQLSGNTADIRLLSLSVADKDEILKDVVSNELAKAEENRKRKKSDFKLEVILETILSSLPIMAVAYFITKMYFEIKTVLLILLFIFIFVFLLVFFAISTYEKVSKKYKKKNDSGPNMAYMLDEEYIKRTVFDTGRYRNSL